MEREGSAHENVTPWPANFSPQVRWVLVAAIASQNPLDTVRHALQIQSHHQMQGFLDRFVQHVFEEVDVLEVGARPANKCLRLQLAPLIVQRSVVAVVVTCWGKMHPTIQRGCQGRLVQHLSDPGMVRLLRRAGLPHHLSQPHRGYQSEHSKLGASIFRGQSMVISKLEEHLDGQILARRLREEEEGSGRGAKWQCLEQGEAEPATGEGGNMPSPSVPGDLPSQVSQSEQREVDTILVSKLRAGIASVRTHASNDSLPKELSSLLNVPNMQGILDQLAWHELSDEVILLLVGVLFTERMNKRQAQAFVSSVILKKVLLLKQPASRSLFSAILKAAKDHPRVAVQYLLLPLLTEQALGSAQVEVINRVVREGLQDGPKLQLLSFILDLHLRPAPGTTAPNSLNNVSIAVLQGLINLKLSVRPEVLEGLVHVVDISSSSLAASPKFSSLILALVSKYGAQLVGHLPQLRRVASELTTSLKKAILSIIVRLQPV